MDTQQLQEYHRLRTTALYAVEAAARSRGLVMRHVGELSRLRYGMSEISGLTIARLTALRQEILEFPSDGTADFSLEQLHKAWESKHAGECQSSV